MEILHFKKSNSTMTPKWHKSDTNSATFILKLQLFQCSLNSDTLSVSCNVKVVTFVSVLCRFCVAFVSLLCRFCVTFVCVSLLCHFCVCVTFVSLLCRFCVTFVSLLCRFCVTFVSLLCRFCVTFCVCASLLSLLCRFCVTFVSLVSLLSYFCGTFVSLLCRFCVSVQYFYVSVIICFMFCLRLLWFCLLSSCRLVEMAKWKTRQLHLATCIIFVVLSFVAPELLCCNKVFLCIWQ